MRKLLTASMVLAAFAILGCASGGMEKGDTGKMEEKKISKETHVLCPKCGVEFTIGDGLKEWEKMH